MLMKTAISIPDPVFDAAEALAERLGISRSALYARAVQAYLEAYKEAGVREVLDRLYEQEASQLDTSLTLLQAASLGDEDW
jgi:metal-responsive CopG/Arc/MetJ family transcriptional regulator